MGGSKHRPCHLLHFLFAQQHHYKKTMVGSTNPNASTSCWSLCNERTSGSAKRGGLTCRFLDSHKMTLFRSSTTSRYAQSNRYQKRRLIDASHNSEAISSP